MTSNFFFTDAITATLVLYLISKCFISASFLIIYPYAGELYPTELRGVGIGTSAYIGGLGLIVIPFINYLVSLPSNISSHIVACLLLLIPTVHVSFLEFHLILRFAKLRYK